MNSKQTILSRIADAQAIAPAEPVSVPREYRRHRELPDAERLALFTERLTDYKAQVHQCTSAKTAATIATVLAGAERVGVPPGLDQAWLSEFAGTVVPDSAALANTELDRLDAVVTASAAGCAETGTIFLDGQADQGRRALTLIPDRHVCVVDLSRVHAGVPEAVSALDPYRPTTLISGPSATSDIELERVEGVHGPRTLIVIIRIDC